jgi:uncharacterized membrane protein
VSRLARRFGLAWWQAVSFVAALAGTAVAAYLVRVHYDEGALICTVSDCETVQQSEYAELWSIPIALFGLGLYLAILGLGAARWRRPAWHGFATLTAFALSLSGALYAAYLTYLELFVIDAICQWCVASAILTIVVLAAETVGVWSWLGPTPVVDGSLVAEGDPARTSRPAASRSEAPAGAGRR